MDLREKIEKMLQENFEWVDDIEDGKYFYMEGSNDTILTNPFVDSILSLFEKTVEEIIGKDEDEYEVGFCEGKMIAVVKKTQEEIPLRMLNKEQDRNELRAIQMSNLLSTIRGEKEGK